MKNIPKLSFNFPAVQEERGPRKNKGQRTIINHKDNSTTSSVTSQSSGHLHLAPPRGNRSPLTMMPPPLHGILPYGPVCPWVSPPRYDFPSLSSMSSFSIGPPIGSGPVPSEVPIGSRGRSAFIKVIPGSTKNKEMKEDNHRISDEQRKYFLSQIYTIILTYKVPSIWGNFKIHQLPAATCQ